MNKDLIAIFDYLEREKGIKREVIIKAIEESLYAAARKSVQNLPNIRIEIDPKTAVIDVLSEKKIVSQVQDTETEISLEEAQELDPESQEGQFIDIVITPKDFGRISAQTARQIITQKLKGAEKDVIYEEYRHRVNEIISGTVKRFVRGSSIIIDLGKVEAILPGRFYPKMEHYRIGSKLQALLLEVKDNENGGAEVVLSRSHPEFVRQLFNLEVPEIADSVVVIEKIVREAGYRTKFTVKTNDSKVDPVGACVGMRGIRVKGVVRELNNEKIDIIPHSDDPIELLQNALSPIEIRKISVNEENNSVSIVVDDEDFPTVIGKKGMNARLNSQLIGADLDVQKMTDFLRKKEIIRTQLSESDDPSLDEQIVEIPLVNQLLIENLIEAGYNTRRKLLQASSKDLADVLGLSADMAENILEQITKEKV